MRTVLVSLMLLSSLALADEFGDTFDQTDAPIAGVSSPPFEGNFTRSGATGIRCATDPDCVLDLGVGVYDGGAEFQAIVGPANDAGLPAGAPIAVNNSLACGFENGPFVTGTRTYLSLPGVANSNATTPDSPALTITGNVIDVRAKVAMNDWTPSATAAFIAQRQTTGNQRSWELRVTNAGIPNWLFSSTGLTTNTAAATTGLSLPDGATKWIRATHQDDGSGNALIRFFTSDDGSTWTQLGADVTFLSSSNLFDSAAPVEVGTTSSGTAPLDGSVFYAEVRRGVNGPVVLTFDPSLAAAGATSFVGPSSETWTVNGTAALKTGALHKLVLKDVTDACSPSIDITTANAVVGPSFYGNDMTVLCVGGTTDRGNTAPNIFSHAIANLNSGFFINSSTSAQTRCFWQDATAQQGVSSVAAGGTSFGRWFVYSCRKSGATYIARSNGAQTSAAATVTAILPAAAPKMAFGTSAYTATQPIRHPFYGCTLFRASLSDARLKAIEAGLFGTTVSTPTGQTALTTVRTSLASLWIGNRLFWVGPNAVLAHPTYGARALTGGTNNLLQRRDLSNVAWVKTNMGAVFDATAGADGLGATTLTATAANATVLQSRTLASSSRRSVAVIKRGVGSGTLEMSNDGTTWTALSSTNCYDPETLASLAPNASTVVECALSATVTNPNVGLRIGTSGDTVIVTMMQDAGSSGSGAISLCDNPTQTGTAICTADAHTVASTGLPVRRGCIEMLFRPKLVASSRLVDTSNGGAAEGYIFAISAGGQPTFSTRNVAGAQKLLATATTTIAAGTQYRLKSCWDDSSVEIYVNNRLEQRVTGDAAIGSIFATVHIGELASGSFQALGSIRDLKFSSSR